MINVSLRNQRKVSEEQKSFLLNVLYESEQPLSSMKQASAIRSDSFYTLKYLEKYQECFS